MNGGLTRRPVALLRVEEARQILAECKRVDDAKSIRDKAEAIRVYLRSQGAATEAQNDAAEIKCRAERRLGELLREQVKPHRPSKVSQRATVLPEGVSRSQSSRWQQVAEVPKEKFEAHLAALRQAGERVTTAALTQEVRRAERFARMPQADAGPLPDGPFAVIYADPPWRYDNAGVRGAAADQYPTMDLAAICSLQVEQRAAPDAVLFLWATVPLRAEALRVIEAWGFTYKSAAVWVKDKIGPGFWFRGQHEDLLLATRGNPPPPAPADRPSSVIGAPAGRHSEKPAEAAELIERMFPTLAKVELFRRGAPRPGWQAWGNEVEKRAAP